FFFQAEDGIRDFHVTGVQTCALPILANIIQWAKNNNLIAILEVHDVTGSGEQSSAGTLYNATSYWIDIASTLQGQEDYVIINIANEPFGNGVPESSWIDGHIQAIQRI